MPAGQNMITGEFVLTMLTVAGIFGMYFLTCAGLIIMAITIFTIVWPIIKWFSIGFILFIVTWTFALMLSGALSVFFGPWLLTRVMMVPVLLYMGVLKFWTIVIG